MELFMNEKELLKIAKKVYLTTLHQEEYNCNKLSLIKTAGVSFENNSFKFDFENDSENDIIKLAAYKLNCTRFKNNVYWFGYKFEENATSSQRTAFINYIKGISGNIPEQDLRRFIELPLFSLKGEFNTYNIDCFVYPISQRSQLVTKMIGIIGECTQHDISRCSFELVKNAPTEIEFDWEMFESLYADTQGYNQMLEHINNEILPKIKQLDYFSLAKTIKPKYRSFITNYIGFPDIETLEKFKKLKGNNILIVDDINTSGSTLNEILRILNKVNQNCNIFIYTLIGK